MAQVPTRASLAKNISRDSVESVVYESYKRKSKIFQEQDDDPKTRVEEFNIKKAKHEVVKFGISGLESAKKEEAKIRLAVKLGAKPLKNKYKNYKELKKERAEQKAADTTKSKFQQLGKNAIGKSLVKTKKRDRKKNMKGGLLEIYGKVKTNMLKKNK